jgi:caffeoyl-CoA O-methyltransferase
MPPDIHGPDHFLRFLPRDGGLMDAIEEDSISRDVPIIGPSVGSLLSVLVRATGAARILELGTANGYSTVFMARALPEGGRITTIEWDPDLAEEARANLRAAGVEDMVEVLVGDALGLVKGMGAGSFDLVFMDIEKEMYSDALADCVTVLREGGLLFVDNVAFRSAGDFADRLHGHPELETSFVHGTFHNHSPEEDAVSLSVKLGGSE